MAISMAPAVEPAMIERRGEGFSFLLEGGGRLVFMPVLGTVVLILSAVERRFGLVWLERKVRSRDSVLLSPSRCRRSANVNGTCKAEVG